MIGTVYADIEQGSEQWYAVKMGLASSSSFRDICAQGRYGNEATSRRNYRARIVLEKLTGITPSRFLLRETEEIKWGKETEELARVEYMLRTGRTMKKIGGIKHPFLDVWSSTDGVDNPDNIRRILEMKCRNSANHYEALCTGKVPTEYEEEVYGELWLSEGEICDFVSFDPDFPPHAQLVIIEVKRDDRYIDNLMVEVSKFLDEVSTAVEFIKNYKEK